MSALKLDLSKHCIQTEIKRQYNRAVLSYFKAGKADKSHIEQTIELTRHALETLDFGRLRSVYRDLGGGGDAAVSLKMRGARLEIAIDGNVVESI